MFCQSYKWNVNLKKIFLLVIALSSIARQEDHPIKVTKDIAKKIGQQIYINECAGKPEYLVYWKDGEDVLSVGIGHFIWCPDEACIFDEGFPELRNHLVKKYKVHVPKEFMGKCPWNNAEELKKDSVKAERLRKLMQDTMDLQVRFMVSKIKVRLPYLLRNLDNQKDKDHVQFQFNRLVKSGPAGLYAIIDYPHFKGTGIKKIENYNGHRWGFLQVLQKMNGLEPGHSAIEEFSSIAKQLLKERVDNAPRKEDQWLAGWNNRIDTYKNFK